MSLQDRLFIENVKGDLRHFLKNDKRKRILVFPPVNNYKRFLIHQLVQDRFFNLLQTFSIGHGFARRTVVCYKSDFIRSPQVNGDCWSTSNKCVVRKSLLSMGTENQCTSTASPERSIYKSKQDKVARAVEIYRPPAARHSRLEKSPANLPNEQTSDSRTRSNHQKRPARALYIPRFRREAMKVDTSNFSAETQCKTSRELIRLNSRQLVNITTNEQTILKDLPTTIKNSTFEKMDVQKIPKKTTISIVTFETEENDQTINFEKKVGNLENNIEKSIINDFIGKIEEEVEVDILNSSLTDNESQEKKTESSSHKSSNFLIESDKRDKKKFIGIDNIDDIHLNKVTEFCNCSITNIAPDKVIKLKSVSNEFNNEKNNKIIKQASASKVLVISDNEVQESTKSVAPSVTSVVPVASPEKKVKKVERLKSKAAPPPSPSTKLNRDECDWDSLFDDNGDCLDPTLIEELTSSVGEVVIEKPKSSYKAYTQSIEVSNKEFGHILEIYNFPSEFKSNDLAAIFNPFKSQGFELKWVDDTHCLGVFSSPLVAAEVLASNHPFVKTRPLSEATALSKTKARRSSELPQPYKTRPETCAALARRLVTKSLGVTLATARQEREQEKILLREAKEKRRLANKQREDVWQGIIDKKPAV